MALRGILLSVFFLFFAFSCSNRGLIVVTDDPDIPLDLPPKQEMPVLRVLDYKNSGEGRVLAPWLRNYLENGIDGSESLAIYQGSYLFIASIRSAKLSVIHQWAGNYAPDRDFSRLAAGRIQKRLDRDVIRPPDKVYGPNYETTLKAAYANSFWGAMRLDDSWVLALSIVEDEDTGREERHYWGFILVGIPRETLEIQVNELLSKISNSTTRGGRSATKEQNAAFESVKGNFFDRF